MESEIAEMLLGSALGSTLPYALAALGRWLRRTDIMHCSMRRAPNR